MPTYIKKLITITFGLLVFIPNFVFAHPNSGDTNSFVAGFSHPLMGLDHLIAMIAVGIWAVQLGGKAKWLLPLSFVVLMIAGGALGFSGISMPLVEMGILASIISLIVLIVGSIKLPTYLSTLVIGVFALFHGHAHGTELPLASATVLGFVVATFVLHLIGLLAMHSYQKWQAQKNLVRAQE
jgi:urease accessory protein